MMSPEERMDYLEQRIAALEELAGILNQPSDHLPWTPPTPQPPIDQIIKAYTNRGWSWRNAKRQARSDQRDGLTLEQIIENIQVFRDRNKPS